MEPAELDFSHHCVKVHVRCTVLVDFEHSVSISEAAVFCRTPWFHSSDLKGLATLVCPQVEAKALSLQTLQMTECGLQTQIRLGVVSNDQSWIINPFLWIEDKTDGQQRKS